MGRYVTSVVQQSFHALTTVQQYRISPAEVAFFHALTNICVFAIIVWEIIQSSPSVAIGVGLVIAACIPSMYHIGMRIAQRRKHKSDSEAVET